MTDKISSAQRSMVMARVRSKNTRPELVVRKLLHRLGYRFRLHRPDLPGKPDVCLPKYRSVILVNGCFWHGHGCKQTRRPATNVTYWEQKIKGNVARDKRIVRKLQQLGWKHLVIWECELRRPGHVRNRIISFLARCE